MTGAVVGTARTVIKSERARWEMDGVARNRERGVGKGKWRKAEIHEGTQQGKEQS